ncbi:pyridoxal phosphate-dependent aminotransferase [Paracoccus sp. S-4012]|uniref:pyridoxal phosphate-dependent aminotransferase n=1 Tax=Paracoccus sp. S-4012 TaxID=2665648 RepID=UPI0012B0BE25|nr:pyridoxal phosphate-dependent aminotransferase [Paracoccus sp. S-4012]MRX49772.1 pyridoxal phosphate-dependent aminotransferase [Paracoccus sp. S-4012]
MDRLRFAPIPATLPATVPFTGPETLERQQGHPFRARLGANENGFGPSPKAVAAMQAAAGEVWKYGDPDNHDLREALAARLGAAAANVMPGEGIDGLLGLAVRLFMAPGETVVTSDGAYPTFNYHVAGFGGALSKVPYRHDAEDPEALTARAAATGARLIYLANPDNPMGSWQPCGRIEAMLEALPAGTLLLLDEAYADFLPPEALPQIDPEDPRVLRFRTFSKAYGMAGARVGYAIGPAAAIAGFDRIRNHFGINRIAQAGALAALSNADWLDATRDKVAAARERITGIGAANGLTALPSATNFVALDTGRDGGFSRRLVAALAARGVFVRMPGTGPLDRCIRVSCGPEAELALFEAALPEALAET